MKNKTFIAANKKVAEDLRYMKQVLCTRLKDLQEIKYSDNRKHCGGFKGCIDRKCDPNGEFCKECVEDAFKAIQECNING